MIVKPTRHGGLKHVLLEGGILPGVTQVATATFAEGEDLEAHQHPTMWEIFYVLEGRARWEVAGETQETGPGDLLPVPPGAPHSHHVLAAPFKVFYWGIATD